MSDRLDAFDLGEVLGKGTTGTVYSATHRATGVRVALKTVQTQARMMSISLDREVAAMVRMYHPHILYLFDHGIAGADAPIEPGVAWLALEYASGGTLADTPPNGWREVHATTLAILDALAYAHGRGIVHRDLKPENVVVSTGADLRPGPKVADFGLAWATDSDRRGIRRGGTPAYIAPEQVRGSVVELGPWTDLYTLGAILWEWVTGQPPFGFGASVQSLLDAHQHAPLPVLQPRIEVPDGLEPMLRSMLAKHVSERPGSAAEVAWHLRRLDPVATEARPEVGSEGGAPTLLSAWPSQPASTKSQAGSAVAESVVSRRSGRLPVPRDWRGYSPAPSTLLTGVGLGLLGRRAATIQGRDAERDAMWAALRDVASTRRPQTVMLVGEPGVGTSRLGGWLVERVRELGIGEAHTVSSEDGLSGAVERAFGVVALKLDAELPEDATPLDRRVFESRVDPRAAEVSAWWMERASNGLVVVFVDSPDGHAELERLVTDPLFGGPQGGSEAACAMLVVTTGTPDAGLIDELAYIERASVVEVPPLPFDHLRDLAELELGLERRLAIRLAREAGGRPAALVLRVRDLAERGGLEPSNEGLRANGQVPLDAPASPDARFDAGWAQLVHATRSGAIGVAVGAVLGETVDLREWRGTLELLGASDARDVVRPLVRMGWVRRTTEHWQFRSPAIRRRVLETIPEAQRQEMELAAAGALNLLEATPERSARRGLHLFLAGHQKAALRVLGPALADVVRERGYALVEAICEQVFRTVDPTTLPLDLRVELEIPWLSARRDMHSGASIRDELLALVDAVSSPDAQVSPAAEKRVRMLTAEVVALLQEPDLAESILEGTEPDARASRIRSIIAHMRGDLDEARKHNEQAYEQAVDPELRGAIANGLGGIEAMAGNEDAAALWFERAASLVEPRQRGIVHGNLAMLQMMRGQPELAYRSARQAWAMSTTLSLRQQGWTAMVVATCAAAMNDDALVRQARERAIFYARRFSSSTPDHGAQPLLERALQTANGLGRAALVEILQTVGDAQSRSD